MLISANMKMYILMLIVNWRRAKKNGKNSFHSVGRFYNMKNPHSRATWWISAKSGLWIDDSNKTDNLWLVKSKPPSLLQEMPISLSECWRRWRQVETLQSYTWMTCCLRADLWAPTWCNMPPSPCIEPKIRRNTHVHLAIDVSCG